MHARPPSLLSTAQAAEYLSLRPQTLRKRRLTGDGPPYIRLGDRPKARVAYRLEDLEDWIAQRTWRSTAAETVARAAK